MSDTITVSNVPTVNIFWSGGWDSTFCVLHTLFTTPNNVHAYYVEPNHRPREKYELAAINQILSILQSKHIEKYLRLTYSYIKRPPRPPSFWYCTDVGDVINRTQHQRKTIVPQLDALIYFARTLNINNPVYGIEQPPEIRFGCHDSISPFVNEAGQLLDQVEIDGEVKTLAPMWLPLQALSFPKIHTSKADMFKVSTDLGFIDMMNLTRSCDADQPTRCGQCHSCQEAFEIPELQYLFEPSSTCDTTINLTMLRKP